MITKFLLTGKPGIGKTTCIIKVRDHFSFKEKFKIGGFLTSEIRETYHGIKD